MLSHNTGRCHPEEHWPFKSWSWSDTQLLRRPEKFKVLTDRPNWTSDSRNKERKGPRTREAAVVGTELRLEWGDELRAQWTSLCEWGKNEP